MSSEDLRLDLESFINTGLIDGRGGWPVKRGEFPPREELGPRLGVSKPGSLVARRVPIDLVEIVRQNVEA